MQFFFEKGKAAKVLRKRTTPLEEAEKVYHEADRKYMALLMNRNVSIQHRASVEDEELKKAELARRRAWVEWMVQKPYVSEGVKRSILARQAKYEQGILC